MTALEILRKLLDQSIVAATRRGHVPGCYGGYWGSDGPLACSKLCQEARRVVTQGDVVQESFA